MDIIISSGCFKLFCRPFVRSVPDINFMVATCLIILCKLEQLEHRYVLLLNSENSQTNIEIRNQLFIINMEMKVIILSL